ncbi:MAG: hypothetical protein CL910_07765 [Deltaproteobacteria bacterium]|jgi:pimeloyl-ACP methyl ester carboxylesterase|nr:hypothetical protein [Deltaproteobacteria bacterium]
MKRMTSRVRVAGQTIPVDEWRPQAGPTVVFLHGYGRRPEHYRMLEHLAADQGFRVLAPFLYPNNALAQPPRSFRACVALTRALLQELASQDRLQGSYTVVGHSTGGSVAQCLANLHPTPGAILALNPVMPVAYGPWGFVTRAARIAANQLLGRSGPALRGWRLHLRHGGGQLANLLRRADVSWALAKDLSGLQLQEIRLLYDACGSRGVRFDLPSAVFQARGDEFFRVPSDLRAWMGLVFDRFELRELRDLRGHEWPLMHPELAAQKVAAWIVGRARLPGAEELTRLTA